MTLDVEVLRYLTTATPADAWQTIIAKTLDITAQPLTPENAPRDVTRRDRDVGALDLFLAASGWDLWGAFGDSVERTSQRLMRWWAEPYSAKAVLILDGLSLRELPWLLQGASKHGFNVESVAVSASELPGETNEFARALGFASRSQLQSNRAGLAHNLQSATTECVALPWHDCAGLVDAVPGTKNWVFWHEWPDNKLHDGSGAGQGLEALTRDVVDQLVSEDFWNFVARLAAGRHVVITSDHGYAATGLFHDANDEETKFLRDAFRSGRSHVGEDSPSYFVPPVAMQIKNTHGAHLLAVGRRKWRSPGGYPTLAHGGLSLLEVLSPFVELTKSGIA
ncbi:hypothetical protein [Dyella sp. S184]|uniref:hypothetical protein n=1 Tax=Dyella sp. S184 TaxID=1641862 RepID=UPI00131E2751|nr:hypothetical protein [Dyella sp. S184]